MLESEVMSDWFRVVPNHKSAWPTETRSNVKWAFSCWKSGWLTSANLKWLITRGSHLCWRCTLVINLAQQDADLTQWCMFCVTFKPAKEMRGKETQVHGTILAVGDRQPSTDRFWTNLFSSLEWIRRRYKALDYIFMSRVWTTLDIRKAGPKIKAPQLS